MEAVSITSPPNPSIPEHHSSQPIELLGKALASEDFCINTAWLLYKWPSSSFTSSPSAANPKVVWTPGSLSLSALHADSLPASHSCFLAGSGAKIRSRTIFEPINTLTVGRLRYNGPSPPGEERVPSVKSLRESCFASIYVL
ncbi:hypothetical protein ETB97_002234 [Aspergillus alliaceus]|uniref:Uncharacterized protein n=1 Tax=Petromyces alliaceus TaxID=209559 RepID=A0A8H6E6F1_PETAA|nr:hypothetical protein ETB97_002234 [Aspergillus burnettii]